MNLIMQKINYSTAARRSQGHILLVDDNMPILHITRWMLLAAGYQVSGLSSGGDVLRAAASVQRT